MTPPNQCPLCGASAAHQSLQTSHVYGDATGRAVFFCASCDVRYLHPAQTAEEEARFYAAEFEPFMATRSATGAGWEGPEKHIIANESQRQRRMRHLAPILRPGSDILEVGCSSGFMLYPLVAENHVGTAIEPSGVFSAYVRSRGIDCYQSIDEMRAARGNAKFDLILHYYVMEHVADPVGFLKTQISLLKPGGKIVFEVPNANDALTTLYKIPAYEKFIWVVSHRWYFSERSLAFAINATGGKGEVGLDQRYDLSNHLVWARDGKPGGMGRFTPTLGQDIEDQYRAALIRAHCCDTLIGFVSA